MSRDIREVGKQEVYQNNGYVENEENGINGRNTYSRRYDSRQTAAASYVQEKQQENDAIYENESSDGYDATSI